MIDYSKMPRRITTRATITLVAYLVFVVATPAVGHICCQDHDHNEEHVNRAVATAHDADIGRNTCNASATDVEEHSSGSPPCCVCQHDLGDSEFQPHLLPTRQSVNLVITSIFHPGTLVCESVPAYESDFHFSVDVRNANQALDSSRTIILLI